MEPLKNSAIFNSPGFQTRSLSCGKKKKISTPRNQNSEHIRFQILFSRSAVQVLSINSRITNKRVTDIINRWRSKISNRDVWLRVNHYSCFSETINYVYYFNGGLRTENHINLRTSFLLITAVKSMIYGRREEEVRLKLNNAWAENSPQLVSDFCFR